MKGCNQWLCIIWQEPWLPSQHCWVLILHLRRTTKQWCLIRSSPISARPTVLPQASSQPQPTVSMAFPGQSWPILRNTSTLRLLSMGMVSCTTLQALGQEVILLRQADLQECCNCERDRRCGSANINMVETSYMNSSLHSLVGKLNSSKWLMKFMRLNNISTYRIEYASILFLCVKLVMYLKSLHTSLLRC